MVPKFSSFQRLARDLQGVGSIDPLTSILNVQKGPTVVEEGLIQLYQHHK